MVRVNGDANNMSEAVQIAFIVATPPLLLGSLQLLVAWKQGKVLRDVHTLSNSQMGDTLWTGMVAARNLAYSQPTQENIRLAAIAEERYTQHQAKQAKVDKRL